MNLTSDTATSVQYVGVNLGSVRFVGTDTDVSRSQPYIDRSSDWPGTVIKFFVTADPTAKWKIRVGYNPLYAGATPTVADLTNWGSEPPAYSTQMASGIVALLDGWWDPQQPRWVQRVYATGSVPATGWIPPLETYGPPSDRAWGGRKFSTAMESLWGWINESDIYQYVCYGIYVANSAGVTGHIDVTITPTGCWNWDGGLWNSSSTSFAKTLYGLHVPK